MLLRLSHGEPYWWGCSWSHEITESYVWGAAVYKMRKFCAPLAFQSNPGKMLQEWGRHCLSAGGYWERKMQYASSQSTESPRSAWKDAVAPPGAGGWGGKSPWHLSHSFSLTHFLTSSTLQRSTSSTQLMAQHQNPSKGGDISGIFVLS